ncbi:MAG: hypothetical protein H9533_15075 [Rhodobacteraceae bacterium]|nr:hypothetical protein [Paracoccaceae bacterium]
MGIFLTAILVYQKLIFFFNTRVGFMPSEQVDESEDVEKHKPSGRGRPRLSFRKSTLIGVRISPSLAAALEEFILDQHEVMSRPEAIRRLVCEWLATKRYLGPRRGGSSQLGVQVVDPENETPSAYAQR